MIFQVEPEVTNSDIKAVSQYMSSGGWLTEHKLTNEFENKISNHIGRKHAIAVPNGTIAIYLSLMSLGIKKGDRVAVPNITMIATVNAILWVGAEPVLIDVDEDFCMSINHLKKIKNLTAVIFVPLNGRIGNGQLVEKWCNNNQIKLIEDSAHSLGTKYKNSNAGNLGDLSVLSFTPHKIITTGQGGMVLTNSKKLANKIIKLKSFNRRAGKSDWHDGFGLNFKFTDLQAALGLSQLGRLKENIETKRKIYKYYKNHIDNEFFSIKEFDENEVPWFFDVVTKNSKARNKLYEYLINNNIETRFSYPALSKQKFLKKYGNKKLNFSESTHNKILWLPSSLGLKNSELKIICDRLNKFKI
tara:strand:+ start:2539 stop:3612 length:1074 start_codon:yes stop_codon:yes gene_type:complete